MAVFEAADYRLVVSADGLAVSYTCWACGGSYGFGEEMRSACCIAHYRSALQAAGKLKGQENA